MFCKVDDCVILNLMENISQIQMPQASRVLKNFSIDSGNKKMFFMIAVLVVVFAGVGTGLVLSKKGSVIGLSSGPSTVKIVNTATEAGIDDPAFKDTAQGVLKEGGIKGEGNFHLERPGGASKNVYLVSTAVDLKLYVGKKVEIRGETQAGKHAGWFMDVGYIKVLE